MYQQVFFSSFSHHSIRPRNVPSASSSGHETHQGQQLISKKLPSLGRCGLALGSQTPAGGDPTESNGKGCVFKPTGLLGTITYHQKNPQKRHFWVDDFCFPQVGYVSSLEGRLMEATALICGICKYKFGSSWEWTSVIVMTIGVVISVMVMMMPMKMVMVMTVMMMPVMTVTLSSASC